MLVAVPGWNLDLLRAALTPDEMPRVRLRDMTVAGRNPGRIIGTVLTAFVREHADRRVRIVGEPIWAGPDGRGVPRLRRARGADQRRARRVARLHPVPVRHQRSCPPSVLTDATRTHPTLASAVRALDQPHLHRPRRGRRVVRRPAEPGSERRRVRRHRARTPARGPPGCSCTTPAGCTGWTTTGSPTSGSSRRNWPSTPSRTRRTAAGCSRSGRRTTTSSCRSRTAAGSRTRWSGAAPPEPPHVGHGLFVVHQLADLVRIHRESTGTTVRVYFRLP